MKALKSIVSAASLFYITLYLPVAFMAYVPLWYTLICKLHPGCKFIGMENAYRLINQLTGFFLHLNPLTPQWTVKERFHLMEVRHILDILAILVIVAVIIFLCTFNRKTLAGNARINLFIILGMSIIIPFFRFFWVKIFHPVLFDNNSWLNTPMDKSFYIMPGVFFKCSVICFIVVSAVINLSIWFLLRRDRGGANPNQST